MQPAYLHQTRRIHPRGTAADLIAFDKPHAHAAARCKQGGRGAVYAAANDNEIVGARHSGAGAGIGKLSYV